MSSPDVPPALLELQRLREGDLPTHGGRTLTYVYDSGLDEADEAGMTGDAGPRLSERMAEVNALLDLASPALRKAPLVAFLDRLSRPTRDAGRPGTDNHEQEEQA